MLFRFIKQLFIILTLCGIISNCQSTTNTKENSAPIERTDSCITNPSHSFELYIPSHSKENKDLPLLVAIDPHGDGKTAINQLKEAVTEYPAILIASNLIQNNDAHYQEELNELIANAKKKYTVGEQIYLIGFSGGARMVLGYSLNHSVGGVIACGAFAVSDELSSIKCPIIGIIGMDDFNFLETAQYILTPSSLPGNAHIEIINSSHNWPAKNKLTDAWGWFQLPNKKYDKQQVLRYIKKQQALIDSLTNVGELLQATCIGRNMSSIKAFEETGSFKVKTSKILNSESYKQSLSRLTESFRFEVKTRQTFMQALLQKDASWWKNEIASLHEKMNSEPEEMKKMAYKRLSGFLGIICYSYARQFAGQQDIPRLSQILMVYRLAEPKNTDMQHFSKTLQELKMQP